mmetsp:Transcript_33431/g.75571  ORF Transcript_33431/g.75571 Transcript_33431/m.75571 type:complete len:577 (-) Transcript_33431:368-2098(-)
MGRPRLAELPQEGGDLRPAEDRAGPDQGGGRGVLEPAARLPQDLPRQRALRVPGRGAGGVRPAGRVQRGAGKERAARGGAQRDQGAVRPACGGLPRHQVDPGGAGRPQAHVGLQGQHQLRLRGLEDQALERGGHRGAGRAEQGDPQEPARHGEREPGDEGVAGVPRRGGRDQEHGGGAALDERAPQPVDAAPALGHARPHLRRQVDRPVQPQVHPQRHHVPQPAPVHGRRVGDGGDRHQGAQDRDQAGGHREELGGDRARVRPVEVVPGHQGDQARGGGGGGPGRGPDGAPDHLRHGQVHGVLQGQGDPLAGGPGPHERHAVGVGDGDPRVELPRAHLPHLGGHPVPAPGRHQALRGDPQRVRGADEGRVQHLELPRGPDGGRPLRPARRDEHQDNPLPEEPERLPGREEDHLPAVLLRLRRGAAGHARERDQPAQDHAVPGRLLRRPRRLQVHRRRGRARRQVKQDGGHHGGQGQGDVPHERALHDAGRGGELPQCADRGHDAVAQGAHGRRVRHGGHVGRSGHPAPARGLALQVLLPERPDDDADLLDDGDHHRPGGVRIRAGGRREEVPGAVQ